MPENNTIPMTVKVALASLLVTVLTTAVLGGIAYGQQTERVEDLEERVAKQEKLEAKLNTLTTQQAVQQVQLQILIDELRETNQRLSDE